MSAPPESLDHWLARIAAPTIAPAGGAAAALAGALAAAAVEMVANLTLEREGYAAVHARAVAAQTRVAGLREAMTALAARDTETLAAFERALALPRGSPDETAARSAAKRAALDAGADVQLALLAHLAELADFAAALAEHGLRSAFGDAATGAFLAAGAARSAYWAARASLEGVTGPEVSRRLEAGLALVERAEAAEWRIRQIASERIS